MFKILFTLVIITVLKERVCSYNLEKPDLQEKLDECQKEVGASKDDVQEIVDLKEASTAEGKCLRNCVALKVKFVDENGRAIKDSYMDVAKNHISSDAYKLSLLEKVVDDCVAIELPEDKCEASSKTLDCLHAQRIASGIELS